MLRKFTSILCAVAAVLVWSTLPARAASPVGRVGYGIMGGHVVICWEGNNCHEFAHANVHGTGYHPYCNDNWLAQTRWNYNAEKVQLLEGDLPKSINSLRQMVADDIEDGQMVGYGYAEFHDCGIPLGGLLQGVVYLDIETPDEDTDGFDGWFYVTEVR